MNTNTLYKIAMFLLVNIVGFFSVSICYHIGLHTDTLPLDASPEDIQSFRSRFFGGIPAVWIVCAVFSLAFFAIQNRLRFVFLAAPVVLPVLYGLYVLFS